ncbi:M23 family metallopeptidase [Neobacillus niacini]|uniref:M23 family metallopeptidase n=1 Tax=Neobacillus niacini TaxID=86668 RepID=UPI0007ABCAA7|nr:M23 family metallopeptidase [Neobacillus niacini]MEC1520689.1 M23 family metallopeptidase [Neobacillus niacini]
MREEENKRSSQSSSVKRFFKKRWVFPAIYIASAAIILTAVLWYQSSDNATDKYGYESSDLTGKKNDTPALEVNSSLENLKMPVKDPMSAVVKMEFYDFNASEDKQEAALVFYNNTYVPHTGVDFTSKDGETFEVVSALSGTVTRVEEDATLGNVIEIEHDKGIVTQYQSVKDVKVEVGDKVKQGQVVAMAGQSLFDEESGTHVHFEIRKDGVAVNPTKFFNKPVSDLHDANTTEQKSVSNPKQQMIEEPTGEEEAPAKEEAPSKDEKTPSKDEKAPSKDETPSDDESSNSTEKTNS